MDPILTPAPSRSLPALSESLGEIYTRMITQCRRWTDRSEYAMLQLPAGTDPQELQAAIMRVLHFCEARMHLYIPYALELSEKEQEGHNCRQCESGCQVGHGDKLLGIRTSFKEILPDMVLLLQLDLVYLVPAQEELEWSKQIQKAQGVLDVVN